MGVRVFTVAAACTCLLTTPRPATARFSPAQDQVQPSGSAELAGTVIATDGAAPVRRARLTLVAAVRGVVIGPTYQRALETLRPFAVPVTLTADRPASVRLSVVRVAE
jgi:hypothetical protein